MTGIQKLHQKGWLDDPNEPYTNVPTECPICHGELWKVDALNLCNILMVGCKNSQCRWCAEYELEEEKDPIKVLHQSIKENDKVLKGLNNGKKKFNSIKGKCIRRRGIGSPRETF